MKIILRCLALLYLLSSSAYSQGTSTKNRVVTQGFRQPTTEPSGGITNIQYLDGLGRPIQGIVKQGSPNSKDLVTGTLSYDEFGRPKKSVLPVEVNTITGAFQEGTEATAASFYQDNSPFSTIDTYESSPFSRVKKQVGPGAAWNGSTKKATEAFYETNTSAIPRWIPSGSGIDGTGTYPAQTLLKIKSKDENENEVIEYSDKDGRIVQKDVQDDNGWITTSYAYDDFGRLAYIIPPGLNALGNSFTFENAKGLVFAYKYDKRGRVTQKWTPGAGWTYFIYNKLNQVMMSQNARQEADKKWSFAKYDALGRVVITGLVQYTSVVARVTLQTEFDAQTSNFYEIRTNASYSNQSIPAGILNTGTWSDLVINYFDNYTWSPAQGDGTGWSYNATGKLTGQKVKELSQANVYRESDYYFDDRDRLVKAFYQNTFSDFNEVTYTYEGLTDDVKTKEIKYKNSSIVTPIKTTYDYDVLGRLTKAKHKINNEAERTLAEYKYDEIGQLIQKRIQPGNYQLIDNIPDVFTRDTPISSTVNDVARIQINLSINGFTILPGGDYTAEIIPSEEESTTDALQIIDYTYHIRGGLRCINCDINGVPKLNEEQNDLFALKLDYEDNIGGPVYYNGNIRQQTWISHNNPTQPRIFNYSYDKADRLNSANYSGGIPNTNENYTVSGIGYDKNSNINAMTRQGMTNTATKTFGTIDQLGYDYHPNTNLLKKITDAVLGNDDVGDFRDAPENPDYDYAPDGSLQVDRNKGITSIVYNELGLPDVVAFTGNKSITYLYDAMGNKLKKTTATSTQTDVIHYDGAVTYFNNQLAYIQHDEGRAINPSLTGGQGTDFVYEYHYRDHLGNLRVAFRQQTAEALRIGATMEPAQAVQEEANFRHVSDTRSGGIAHTGNFSAELKGESGPSKTMRVVAGERITASVFGYLPEPEKEKKKGLVPIPILGPEKIQTEMSTRNHWLLRGGLLVPFTYHKKQNREEAKTNAYLQVVLLDTAGKPVYTERKYLDSVAVGGWKELKIALTPTQNGTLQVSLVNENARVAAYFDDLTITDEPPLIVQENHYDPWGLNLVGIEVTGTPEDLYQFNGGSEKSYSLHDKSYLYETDFRFYDPQSGRFWGVDAMADEFGSVSPMQFGYNNPMSFNDPTGLFSGPGPYYFGQLGHMHGGINLGGLIGSVTNTGMGLMNSKMQAGSTGITKPQFSNGMVGTGTIRPASPSFMQATGQYLRSGGGSIDPFALIAGNLIDQTFDGLHSIGHYLTGQYKDSHYDGRGFENYQDRVGTGINGLLLASGPLLKMPNLNKASMYRRTKNVGVFAELNVNMELKTVKEIARKGGVGLKGVKIRINRQPELLNTNFVASANKNVITLYPNSFRSEEELVRTLAHERTHIFQYKVYGQNHVFNNPGIMEEAAYGIEETFVKFWKSKIVNK